MIEEVNFEVSLQEAVLEGTALREAERKGKALGDAQQLGIFEMVWGESGQF